MASNNNCPSPRRQCFDELLRKVPISIQQIPFHDNHCCEVAHKARFDPVILSGRRQEPGSVSIGVTTKQTSVLLICLFSDGVNPELIYQTQVSISSLRVQMWRVWSRLLYTSSGVMWSRKPQTDHYVVLGLGKKFVTRSWRKSQSCSLKCVFVFRLQSKTRLVFLRELDVSCRRLPVQTSLCISALI